MRKIEEILNNKKVIFTFKQVNNDKSIQLKLNVNSDVENDVALATFTKALDWEHLSISFKDKTPSWDCMNEMKEIFWKDDEVCIQLHPAKSNYINNHEHCLHIWRSLKQEVLTPPSVLVGFRKGHEEEDMKILKQVQKELGNPLSDKHLDLIMAYSKNDVIKIAEILNNMSLTEMLSILKGGI